MKKILFCILILSPVFPSTAQVLTQSITGQVVDRFTKAPVIAASILILDSDPVNGTLTDTSGYFRITGVPVGRQSIRISCLGYQSVYMSNIILSSGKELSLTIEMEESAVKLDEVVVQATQIPRPKNDYAYVSSRSFSVEETERYSGTNGDPARMASYFAGVMGGGDTRNDIIIRGNSPLGLLWRVEGVDIPNPNHFASMGTNGGPICILNNNQLTNSDFMTSAFPAEYGNATSGVFDLHMRNGNNQKREVLAMMGVGGLEAGMEGYFVKGKSSYMINYRHAFLGLVSKLGINFNIPAIPRYQDLSYKFHFPVNQKNNISVWGLGGTGSINMLASESKLSATNGINTIFGSGMGASGINYHHIINPSSALTSYAAYTVYTNYTGVDSVNPGAEPYRIYGSNFNERKYMFGTVYKYRVSQRFRFTTGLRYTGTSVNYRDSAYTGNRFIDLANNRGSFGMIQSYAQSEYNLTNRLSATAGLHFQYLTLNNGKSMEPRVAIRYRISTATSVYTGYGRHSQLQPGNVYFIKTLTDTISNRYVETNRNLGFTKSDHFTIGFNHFITTHVNLKIEGYYQNLSNLPVESGASSYSLINYGASFYNFINDSLVNKGTGRNLGIEATLERYFYKSFYYMITVSLFDSKYKGSDGILRPTLFDNNYILNMLGGYEFKLPNNELLAVNMNLVWAGGLRYIPIDLARSAAEHTTVYDQSRAYAEKFHDFFKANIRLIYRVNRKKFSYECAFEINNITNRKNILYQSYDPSTNTVKTDYQMGLMPGGFCRFYF